MAGNVGGRWISYTLLMLVAAVLVAIVLPTQYSLGLLGTLGYLLSGLIQIIQAIIYFIAFLIVSFLSLFFPNIEEGGPLTKTLPRPTTPLGAPDYPPPSLSEFVQSLIFWAVFFIIVGYVLAQFLRRHPEIVEALKHIPGMTMLVRLWQRLRTWSVDCHSSSRICVKRDEKRGNHSNPIGLRVPPLDQSAQTIAAAAGAVLLLGHAPSQRRERPSAPAHADAV